MADSRKWMKPLAVKSRTRAIAQQKIESEPFNTFGIPYNGNPIRECRQGMGRCEWNGIMPSAAEEWGATPADFTEACDAINVEPGECSWGVISECYDYSWDGQTTKSVCRWGKGIAMHPPIPA
jgi:hypothetical protein